MSISEELAKEIFCHAPHDPEHPCDEDCYCARHHRQAIKIIERIQVEAKENEVFREFYLDVSALLGRQGSEVYSLLDQLKILVQEERHG